MPFFLTPCPHSVQLRQQIRQAGLTRDITGQITRQCVVEGPRHKQRTRVLAKEAAQFGCTLQAFRDQFISSVDDGDQIAQIMTEQIVGFAAIGECNKLGGQEEWRRHQSYRRSAWQLRRRCGCQCHRITAIREAES